MEEVTQEILKNHKLSISDYEAIKKILGREPNLVEIGIFSAMWSEHCSYKSSKVYLKNFPTSAPYVIQGPGENAGIIDIGEGYCAVFKMESHNHPSFIEPYAGAATGVGGILRDIFTMGARPIANLDSIRFGEIANLANLKSSEQNRESSGLECESSKTAANIKKHKYLLRGVVAGIGDYGNCMGIPTIGGETSFEACYNGNILVNAFNLGIVKKDNIFYGKASGVGNPVIYVGSKTGRDGLGGAVMSSDSFNEDSLSLRPTVQVGDPFSEKLLLEACLELFGKDLIVGIQDMGAAGLTSSSFEMASRAGEKSGMKLFLDKVPMREGGMNPYELMLSESQERMLICAKKGAESEVVEIFKKWEIDAAIIGEVTNSGRMELFWDNELCADIPIAPLAASAPILEREVARPNYIDEVRNIRIAPHNQSQNDIFRAMLAHPEICDKSWIYTQYDSTIQVNTIIGSGRGDASVVRVRENGAMLAMNLYCNPRFCYLDPKMGAKIAVATAGRNCATRGAVPLAITDCLNFGNPNNPFVMWQFREACAGIAEACEILKTPVVSGNVSLHNQSDNIDIYPTPSIGMVGKVRNVACLRDSALKSRGNLIVLLGALGEDFGGSLWLKMLYGQVALEAPKINLFREFALWDILTNADFIKSAKSVKEGGVAIALAKMALFGGFGLEVELNMTKDIIFSETQSLACVEIEELDLNKLDLLAKQNSIPYTIIGKVGAKGANLNIDSIAITQNEARELYFGSFAKLMEM